MNEISLEELASIAKQRPKKRRQTDWLPIIIPGIAIVGLLAGLVYAVQANRSSGKQSGNAGALSLGQAIWGSAEIKTAKCELAWEHGYRNSTRVVLFKVGVRNSTRTAIEDLTFYVRAKNPSRSIPIGESTETIKIPGGIEPGESKEISFSVTASTFGSNDYKPIPDEPFEIAIAENAQKVSRDMPMQRVVSMFKR